MEGTTRLGAELARRARPGTCAPADLALYQPSMQMESYRMEFLVKIEKQAVGWVYRATDQENYYAAKITDRQARPAAACSHWCGTR